MPGSISLANPAGKYCFNCAHWPWHLRTLQVCCLWVARIDAANALGLATATALRIVVGWLHKHLHTRNGCDCKRTSCRTSAFRLEARIQRN